MPNKPLVSEELRADLKKLYAQSERLRAQATKNAEQAAIIMDKIAAIQRRVMDADSARAKKKSSQV